MINDNFYNDLPTFSDFAKITDFKSYTDIPKDWYVLITDIKGSTQAIEDGKYKDVNMLAACSIIAILNVSKSIEIPFVFGGDGATVIVPPSLLEACKRALVAVEDLAQTAFNMHLRIGIVKVQDIIGNGFQVKVAKYKVSDNYIQAMFTGGGLTHAEDLIKNQETEGIYKLDPVGIKPEADFSGLECRWHDIVSLEGEVISVLIKANNSDIKHQIYNDVIRSITKIYGNIERRNPVKLENLNLSTSRKNLVAESNIKAANKGIIAKFLYLNKIKSQNLIGKVLIKFGVKGWGKYKNTVKRSTDSEKFDDMLRMVISGNKSQRRELESFLEKLFKEGKLAYGIHTSDRALMTCLVFERSGRQVHFIDGADGGYALAAKEFKKRLSLID
jgi:hypothetical protein